MEEEGHAESVSARLMREEEIYCLLRPDTYQEVRQKKIGDYLVR